MPRPGSYPWPVGQRRRRRYFPRYKKTGILLAGFGVALGFGAVVLWPQLKKLFQKPVIKVGTPTLTPIPDSEIDPAFVDSLSQYLNQ